MYMLEIDGQFKALLSMSLEGAEQRSVTRLAIALPKNRMSAGDERVLKILETLTANQTRVFDNGDSDEQIILASSRNIIKVFEFDECAMTLKGFVELLQEWGLTVEVDSFISSVRRSVETTVV